jgi:hypothetical protein
MNPRVARLVLLSTAACTAFGQGGDAMWNMQEIAQSLGVECSYCHARMAQGNAAPPPDGQIGAPSKQAIAGAMIAMTRDLNAKVLTATGKPASDVTRVTCYTRHHGVPVPGQLSDIVARTTLQKGPDAAIAQYRDLRVRYYGHAAYDFSEDTLLTSAQVITRVKPQASIPILQLNLEFYPRSARSYIQIAYAYTREIKDDDAIAALEKALEIEPENGIVKGQLEQLRSYHRRK